MANQIAGWTLFAIGVITWGIAVYRFVTTSKPSDEDIRRGIESGDVAKILEAIAKILEQLRQFSEAAQWALLSLVPLGAGIYILAAKPL
jgi:hypothetical protein